MNYCVTVLCTVLYKLAVLYTDSGYAPNFCPATCVCVWDWFLMHGWMLCVPVIILCVYISHGHMKEHKEHLHCLCVCALWQKDSSLHFFKASLFSVEPGLWTKTDLKRRVNQRVETSEKHELNKSNVTYLL